MNRILLTLAFLCLTSPVLAEPLPMPTPAAGRILGGTREPAESRPASGITLAELQPAELAFVTRGTLCGWQAGEVDAAQARQALEGLLRVPVEPESYEASAAARALAEGALAFRRSDPDLARRLVDRAEELLQPVENWLQDHGRFAKVHGFEEPIWVRGRPEVLAQAVLAWIALEEGGANPARRQAVEKAAEGLKTLLRGEFSRYPFGAHLSAVTLEGRPRTFVSPATGGPVAGLSWIVERNYTVCALSRAARMLDNPALLDSARREGLGGLAQMAVSGIIPYGFAPRPEVEVSTPLGVAAVVENLAALQEASGAPEFSALTGLAATRLHGEGPLYQAARRLVLRRVAQAGAQRWDGARDVCRPFAYQTVEAEHGRAVEKAFEAVPIRYPGGTPGHLAVVGRENMFWMRFDVDREDEYFFHLSFLKSAVSGGLVSVMMRIDGDQIFQVNLGGATDDPFVDVDRVAGPRHLRQGPHSFGIRFSGLLMRQPAVLDSVLVHPAVGRRWLRLKDGRRILAMKSLAEDPLRVRMEELEHEGSPDWTLVSGMGTTVQPRLSTDRRGRVWLEMPAGGVAFLEWKGAIPGVEEVDWEEER